MKKTEALITLFNSLSDEEKKDFVKAISTSKEEESTSTDSEEDVYPLIGYNNPFREFILKAHNYELALYHADSNNYDKSKIIYDSKTYDQLSDYLNKAEDFYNANYTPLSVQAITMMYMFDYEKVAQDSGLTIENILNSILHVMYNIVFWQKSNYYQDGRICGFRIPAEEDDEGDYINLFYDFCSTDNAY